MLGCISHHKRNRITFISRVNRITTAMAPNLEIRTFSAASRHSVHEWYFLCTPQSHTHKQTYNQHIEFAYTLKYIRSRNLFNMVRDTVLKIDTTRYRDSLPLRIFNFSCLYLRGGDHDVTEHIVDECIFGVIYR